MDYKRNKKKEYKIDYKVYMNSLKDQPKSWIESIVIDGKDNLLLEDLYLNGRDFIRITTREEKVVYLNKNRILSVEVIRNEE